MAPSVSMRFKSFGKSSEREDESIFTGTPGMSKVISATPSDVTSNVKFEVIDLAEQYR